MCQQIGNEVFLSTVSFFNEHHAVRNELGEHGDKASSTSEPVSLDSSVVLSWFIAFSSKVLSLLLHVLLILEVNLSCRNVF